MLIKEKTRREVEEKLKSLGDFVKIDYLTSCLKQQVDFDTRKFVLLQLSKLYEDKKMFVEAGKMIELAANINTTFQNQINDFLKAAELFVKGGDFDKADKSFEKALVAGNTVEKVMIKHRRKEIYIQQAEFYLKNDRRNHAALSYERLLSFDLDILEKKKVQEKLLNLYEKLGKIRDYYSLKRIM